MASEMLRLPVPVRGRGDKSSLFRGFSDPGVQFVSESRVTALNERQTSARQTSATLPSQKHLNGTSKMTLRSRFTRLLMKQPTEPKLAFRRKNVTLLRYKCRSLNLESLADSETSPPDSPPQSVTPPPSVSPPPSPLSPKLKRQPPIKRKISTDLDIPLPPVDVSL